VHRYVFVCVCVCACSRGFLVKRVSRFNFFSKLPSVICIFEEEYRLRSTTAVILERSISGQARTFARVNELVAGRFMCIVPVKLYVGAPMRILICVCETPVN